jgi:predicted MFS family arabinose efflux permease
MKIGAGRVSTACGTGSSAAHFSSGQLSGDGSATLGVTAPANPHAPAKSSLFKQGPADFWRLWMVGLVIFTVRWLETIVVAVFVYRHTGSPFIVASVTMLRLLPMGLLGAFLGAWAERIDKRLTLIVMVTIMLSASLSLGVLAWTGELAVWHVALASFVNGVGWATDNPVRRALIGEVTGPAQMATAMSLDVGANNASRMIGPTIGGLLLASMGISGVFILSVCLYALALFSAIRICHRDSRISIGAPVLDRIAEGLHFVRRDRRLIGTLVVTIIYNLFGWPFTSMVAVIGQDTLHLDAEGIGILASMDGVGAFFGALLLTLFLRPSWYGRAYVGGIAAYLVMLTVFALCSHPAIAGTALLLTGLGGAGFSTMQATLVYLSSPPEMRSRILGVLSVCIGVGPFGFVGLGMLANANGAGAATTATGITGLLALLLARPLWRHI